MNAKINIHKKYLNVRLESLKFWIVPDDVKQDLLQFIDDLELGKVNKGKKISESRRLKYLDSLRTPRYAWQRFPEREKLQRRLLHIEEEKRRLAELHEDKMQGLLDRLLSLMHKHEMLRV